jgi:TctA family transporter
MINDIGKKIKGIANFLTIFGILVSIIIGIDTMVGVNNITSHETKLFYGFVIIIVGSVLSYLLSLLLYGFVQLIECVQNIEKYFCKTQETTNSETISDVLNKEKKFTSDCCSSCGAKLEENAKFCIKCGKNIE